MVNLSKFITAFILSSYHLCESQYPLDSKDESEFCKEHSSLFQCIFILLGVILFNVLSTVMWVLCAVYWVAGLQASAVNSLSCLISSSVTVCQWAWCCDQCYQVTTVQEVSRHCHLRKGSPSDALVPETKTEEGKRVSCWRQVITRALLMEGSGKVGMHLIKS